MISIVLVENIDKDREEIISHLKAHVDFDIMGLGYNGFDALSLTSKCKPDIVILSLNLNLYDDIEVSHLLKRKSPETAVVLMGLRPEEPMMKKYIESQASAYLLKEEDLANLAVILRRVKAGETYVNHRIGIQALTLLAELQRGNRRSVTQHKELIKLTLREFQILRLISQGFTDKEIADNIQLKNGTVRNYVSQIMGKTRLKNRAQLVRYAITNGLAGSV